MYNFEYKLRTAVNSPILTGFFFYAFQGTKKEKTLQNKIQWAACLLSGCKESQFYSLPFGQAVASLYQPTSHFN